MKKHYFSATATVVTKGLLKNNINHNDVYCIEQPENETDEIFFKNLRSRVFKKIKEDFFNIKITEIWISNISKVG